MIGARAVGVAVRRRFAPAGRAPLVARLRVWLGRSRLDRELADGCGPKASDLHALRARQLVGRPVRHEVAASLRRVVDDAGQPYAVLNATSLRRGGALVSLCSSEVLEWRGGLLGLADRLQAPPPVNPRGVAQARVLLGDGAGPLYNLLPRRPLGETLWSIADGLQLCPPQGRGGPVMGTPAREEHPHDHDRA